MRRISRRLQGLDPLGKKASAMASGGAGVRRTGSATATATATKSTSASSRRRTGGKAPSKANSGNGKTRKVAKRGRAGGSQPPSKLSRTESSTSSSPALFKAGTLSRDFERTRWNKGYKVIAGVDEAGRGPLAGPVVAAACVVPPDVNIEGIHDSKKLSEQDREILFEQLTTHPEISYGISFQDHKVIDDVNILQATMLAMEEGVRKLPQAARPDLILIDGPRVPSGLVGDSWDIEAVVKGDSKSYSIAAASVIAKVTRDRYMQEAHKKWPQYDFVGHKGYPTPAHKAAVRKHGPCPIHRLTFAPLKTMDLSKYDLS